MEIEDAEYEKLPEVLKGYMEWYHHQMDLIGGADDEIVIVKEEYLNRVKKHVDAYRERIRVVHEGMKLRVEELMEDLGLKGGDQVAKNLWQKVDHEMDRMAVPGGWIYKFHYRPPVLQFVPNNENATLVDGIGSILELYRENKDKITVTDITTRLYALLNKAGPYRWTMD